MAHTDATLKAEILTDPLGLGYAVFFNPVSPGDHAMQPDEIATILNTVRVGSAVPRGLVPAYEVVREIVPSDVPNGAADRDLLTWLLQTGASTTRDPSAGGPDGFGTAMFDLSDVKVLALLEAVFGGASATYIAILTIAGTDVSRAIELFQHNIRHSDVSQALRS